METLFVGGAWPCCPDVESQAQRNCRIWKWWEGSGRLYDGLFFSKWLRGGGENQRPSKCFGAPRELIFSDGPPGHSPSFHPQHQLQLPTFSKWVLTEFANFGSAFLEPTGAVFQSASAPLSLIIPLSSVIFPLGLIPWLHSSAPEIKT